MLTRRGFSLVEMMVAMLLTAIVLAVATSSLLRQQRTHADLRLLTDADAQLRSTTLTLAEQLSAIDASAGDLTAGEAEDSAMQFRAPVTHAIACARGIGTTLLLPNQPTQIPLSGSATLAHVGDSLWWLADSAWLGRRITAVTSVSASCGAPPITGATLRLDIAGADTISAGAPLRVTRQARYGIYRASDGTWQLGYREWNDPTQRFAPPQPVAGPLLMKTGNWRSGFRYFDSTGTELSPTSQPVDVSRVVRIRVTALSLVRTREIGRDSVRADSVDIAVRAHLP